MQDGREGDAGDLGELNAGERHQFVRRDARILRRGRLRSVPGPGIHVGEQRAEGPGVGVGVREVLCTAARRRERGRPVLASAEHIDAGAGRQLDVAASIERDVNQGGGPAVVFIFRIHVEDLGPEFRSHRMRQQAVLDAGLRVGLFEIGKGENIHRCERVREGVAIARRLGETHVKAAASTARYVNQHAIEHFAVALIAIETVIQHGAEEAATLRDAESVGALQREVRGRRTGYEAAETQPGNHIAHGGETGAGHRRIFGGVNQLVNPAGIEAVLGHDGRAVFDVPVGAGNGSARAFHLVANSQAEVGIVGIENGVGLVIAIRNAVTGFVAIQRELRAYDALDALGDRRIEIYQVGRIRHVELPAHPQQRVALIHQQAVAEVVGAAWVE